MSSQGSVTTAPAAGSGLPVLTKGNKMKLDMPPRPVKSNSRRPQPQSQSAAGAPATTAPGGTAGGATNAMNAGAQQQQGGGAVKDDGSVPHVVRVTFLGVAGLLARTPQEHRTAGAPSASPDAGGVVGTEPSSSSHRPINSPASANHPSLLFPLPTNLRVVASVSRSRTARGIPSGISKCLAPSGGGGGSDGPSSSLSPSSTAAFAGSFSLSPTLGEKILVEKQPSTFRRNRQPPGIEEVSISRSSTIEFEDKDPNKNVVSSAKNLHRGKGSKGGGGKSMSFDPAPPSQLLHSRTSSTHRSGRGSRASGGGTGGGGGGASVESSSVASPGSGSSKTAKSPTGPDALDEECIEVIRPYSPTAAAEGGGMGGTRQKKKKKKLLGVVVGGSGGEADAAASSPGVPPERFVAVWDENSRPPPSGRQPEGAAGDAAAATQRQQRQQFVNSTNSLAFEAELRPSASSQGGDDAEGRAATPAASTTFAPKSFCVTVGLVPDFDGAERGRGRRGLAPALDEIGERRETSTAPAPPPTFAIPVGFADLVINGDETLDGRRRQIDLPLSSLGNFVGSIGGVVGEKLPETKGGGYPFPLIELTADGLVAASKDEPKNNDAAAAVSATITKRTTGKVKKKSIVKRMFMRKQQSSPASPGTAPTAERASRGMSPPRVYKGPPRSVFQLDRPPNARERTLFLDRYSVDPSGDAVVRIGLEVFPRGSELEKIFRQKNKLRKKAQAAAAAASMASLAGGSRSSAMGDRGGGRSNGRFSPPSVGSRTVETADSRSLMDEADDEDDEAMLSSDCDDSVFSQSFFTLDSDASRTTWDESTMYTDALSSFNTIGDDSMSYTTGYTEYEKDRARRGGSSGGKSNQLSANFFTSLLNCNAPTTCGEVDDEDMAMDRLDAVEERSSSPSSSLAKERAPYANIDAVASAVASMSMADSDSTAKVNFSANPIMDPTSPHKSVTSIASMETTARTGGNSRRAISPDSIKESGEELTLDTIGPAPAPTTAARGGAGGRGGGVGFGPLPSVDTTIPAILRSNTTHTAHTVSNESSPLAMIKQRVGSADIDELDSRRRDLPSDDIEGHEFTLEEHQSASM